MSISGESSFVGSAASFAYSAGGGVSSGGAMLASDATSRELAGLRKVIQENIRQTFGLFG